MKKLQILIIVFLISLSISAFACMQVKACYWITVTQTANGQITPGTIAVEIGDTPSFTITPDAGYQIAGIIANGEPVIVTSPSGQSYQFSAISGDGALTATFAIKTFTITVTQTANGQITPSTITANYGSCHGFVIHPDSGYYIASITIDAGSVAVTSPSSQTVGFINIQAAHTITATFAAKTYAITVFTGAHGKVTPGNQTVNLGTALSFTITPDIGYHVADVIVNGSSVGPVVSLNFITTGATSISASFAANTTPTVASGLINTTGIISLSLVLIIALISSVIIVRASRRKKPK